MTFWTLLAPSVTLCFCLTTSSYLSTFCFQIHQLQTLLKLELSHMWSAAKISFPENNIIEFDTYPSIYLYSIFVLLNNTPHHFEKKVIFILHTKNKKVTFNGKDNCIWGQCIFLALQTLAFWMTHIISTCQNYHNYLVVIIILM